MTSIKNETPLLSKQQLGAQDEHKRTTSMVLGGMIPCNGLWYHGMDLIIHLLDGGLEKSKLVQPATDGHHES
ncbi:hypothetical protein HAX54_034305, partial [Datura stramonium]|nr:hypothetical protein [Datura stramonium]